MKRIIYALLILASATLACEVIGSETRVIEVTKIIEVTQIVPAAQNDAGTPEAPASTVSGGGPEVAGCPIFPADHIWNVRVDNLPVHPKSDAYVNAIGRKETMHADFGSGTWEGEPIGIPFNIVPGSQPKVEVSFEYTDESDPGPYPVPQDVNIEGGPHSDGDRHALLLDQDNCIIYELFYAFPENDGSWSAGSGAIFDLNSYDLRPDGWTSADAAGLAIFPGLVHYDEIIAGRIDHAVRFTTDRTQQAYVWPARHFASQITNPNVPPMGLRFRMKADYNISGFSHEVQVILQALKTYGMILSDNGSPWFISGVPDPRWDNDNLHEFHQVPGAAFEAVDVSSLLINPDSGQAHTSD